jgi:hypothetical protein
MADYYGDIISSSIMSDGIGNVDCSGDLAKGYMISDGVGNVDQQADNVLLAMASLPVYYKMIGLRASDSTWVTWIVATVPDFTGAFYSGGTLVAGTIFAEG